MARESCGWKILHSQRLRRASRQRRAQPSPVPGTSMPIQRAQNGDVSIVPDDLEVQAQQLAHEHVRLAVINDALVARNLQLLELLEQQHHALDALQTFVVAVSRALESTRMSFSTDPRRSISQQQLANLTERQRQVLAMVVAGHPSKRIAALLGISQRTVENHRASIMTKTGAASVPALTQLALIAGLAG
jgi:DNA-binding CsgD family transcriptional regulator